MSELINAPEPILQFILKSSQLYYKGKILVFTEDDLNKLTTSLPSVWWNDKDRMIYFTYYADGSYYCEREKTVYNYAIKDTVSLPYEFTVLSQSEAHTVYLIMCKFFEDIRLKQLIDEKEELRKKIFNEFDYIKVDFTGTRRKLLIDSDWTQLSDVLLVMDENKKNMWIKYRQYLRDMTDLDAWKNAEYINVVFPASPDTILQKYPNLTAEEYLTTENHFEYFTTVAINNRIKSFLYSIRLLTTTEYDEELKSLVSDPINTSIDTYKKVLQNINEKISQIDRSLKMSIKLVIDDTNYVVTEDGATKLDNVIYQDSVEVINTLIEENSQK